MARQKREALVISRPYRGVFLTEAGADLADPVRARHRTVIDLLLAIGVPEDAAEGDAMRGVTWVRVKEVKSGQWGIGGTTPSTADIKAMAAG